MMPASAAPSAKPVCCALGSSDPARSRSSRPECTTTSLMMYPHIMPKPAVPKNAEATMSQSGPQGMNQACAARPTASRALPTRISRPSCAGAMPDRKNAPAPQPRVSVTTTRPASSGVNW